MKTLSLRSSNFMFRICNFVILLYAAIVISFIFYQVLNRSEGIYKIYYYTFTNQLLLIFLYTTYLIGSIVNLGNTKAGSHILLFGCCGFIVSAIADAIFVHTYPFPFYLVYFIVNASVFYVINRDVIIRRGLYYFIGSAVIVLLLLATLKVSLVL